MPQALSPGPYSPPGPSALSPQQRDVLSLLYDPEGRPCRTPKVVAQRLGCSPSRIGKVQQKALVRLRVLQRMLWAGQSLGPQQVADWQQFRAVIEEP